MTVWMSSATTGEATATGIATIAGANAASCIRRSLRMVTAAAGSLSRCGFRSTKKHSPNQLADNASEIPEKRTNATTWSLWSPVRMAEEITEVGQGRMLVSSRYSRLSDISAELTLLRRRNMAWWVSQTTPMIANAARYAMYAPHSCASSCRNRPRSVGACNSRTSSVMAIAITPSLNASTRPVSGNSFDSGDAVVMVPSATAGFCRRCGRLPGLHALDVPSRGDRSATVPLEAHRTRPFRRVWRVHRSRRGRPDRVH